MSSSVLHPFLQKKALLEQQMKSVSSSFPCVFFFKYNNLVKGGEVVF